MPFMLKPFSLFPRFSAPPPPVYPSFTTKNMFFKKTGRRFELKGERKGFDVRNSFRKADLRWHVPRFFFRPEERSGSRFSRDAMIVFIFNKLVTLSRCIIAIYGSLRLPASNFPISADPFFRPSFLLSMIHNSFPFLFFSLSDFIVPTSEMSFSFVPFLLLILFTISNL